MPTQNLPYGDTSLKNDCLIQFISDRSNAMDRISFMNYWSQGAEQLASAKNNNLAVMSLEFLKQGNRIEFF